VHSLVRNKLSVVQIIMKLKLLDTAMSIVQIFQLTEAWYALCVLYTVCR